MILITYFQNMFEVMHTFSQNKFLFNHFRRTYRRDNELLAYSCFLETYKHDSSFHMNGAKTRELFSSRPCQCWHLFSLPAPFFLHVIKYFSYFQA
jgi:hypothetical protein